MIAFTRCVSESLGDEKKWVHYGLTSTDVVDTAYGYQLKQANDILRQDLKDFTQIVADQAKKYKHTVMMGRTHGVHAEPTTFGLKLARWYSEMKRNMERFEHAAKGVEAGKISGAVGTFANIDPFVEKYVCEKLGIRAQEISSQVVSLLLRQVLKNLQRKFAVCKNQNVVKLKNTLQRGKKVLQLCRISVIQLVLKTFAGWHAFVADIC